MSSPFDQLTSKDGAAPNRFHDNKYGDADRREIVKALEQGARRTIARAALYAALHSIEDVAAEYLALKSAAQPFPARGKRRKFPARGRRRRWTAPSERRKFPARSEQRKQLNRLASAKPLLFKKAALALHPALWPSIAMRAEGLPHHQQVKLICPLREPDGMDVETMMRYRCIIQAAAARARTYFDELSSKPGP